MARERGKRGYNIVKWEAPTLSNQHRGVLGLKNLRKQKILLCKNEYGDFAQRRGHFGEDL